MKRNKAYSLLASIVVLAVLVSCMLSGVVLPVAAAESEPYTLGDEVLGNGDFSQGALVNWGNTAYYSATAGQGGGAGLSLNSNGAVAQYRSDVELEPVTTYMLSFAYLDVADTTFYVESGIECIGRVTVKTTGTGEWKTVNHKFTTPVEIVWEESTDGDSSTIIPGFNITQGDNEVVDDGTVSTGKEDEKHATVAALSVVCVNANAEAPVAVDTFSLREYIPTTKADTLVLTDFSDDNGEQKVNRLWMLIGAQRTLNVKLSNSADTTLACDARSLTWDSDNEEVATVENGRVTAKAEGETKVTATLTDTVSGTPLTAEIMVKVVDYTLPEEAPFSLGANLLQDGKFEKEIHTDYWDGPIDTLVKDGEGRGGSNGLVFSEAGQTINYKKIIGLKKATKYVFSFDYLAMPNNEILVNAQHLGGGRHTITLGSTADSTWKTVTVVGTTAASLNVDRGSLITVQCLKLNADAPVVIDNFVLCEYTEKTVAKSIDLTDKVTLFVGQTASLPVIATPAEGNVNGTTWATTDSTVATVDSGYIVAKAKGETTITATAPGGATASCVVTVTNPDKTAPVNLTADELSWTGDGGKGQVTPGTPLKFSATIGNTGENAVPADEDKPITLDIAMDGEVIRTLTYTGGLAAGASVTVTDSQTWEAVEGDHIMSVRVNADWSIYETDAVKDNTYQLGLRVANDTIEPSDWAAKAVAEAGMDRLTFSDDFSSESVDITGSGREGYKWYVNRPYGARRLMSSDYDVTNGILTIKDKAGSNLCLTSADYSTRTGYSFAKGYMEIRFQIVNPSGQAPGRLPGIWSFPENKMFEISGENSAWVEVDWMEYWGISPRIPEGSYTITLHDSQNHGEHVYQNGNYQQYGLGDNNWHTMGWLWEDNRLVSYLDGVEVMHLLWDEETTAIRGAGIIGQYALLNQDAQVLILGASMNNPMKVDYVRVWQASEPETVSNNMTLSQTDVTMYETDQEKLAVTVPVGQDAGTLSWASSDPSVVTVHGDGRLYARKTGKATVSATNANGVTVLCNVTVKHNLLTGGDFEFEPWEDVIIPHWNIILDGGMSIVPDPDPNNANNHVLKMPATQGYKTYWNHLLKGDTTYVVTGRVRSATKTLSNVTIMGSGGNPYKIPTVTAEWTDFSFEIYNQTNPGPYGLAFGHDSGGNSVGDDIYLDNLVFTVKGDETQSSYPLTLGATANGSVELTVNGEEVISEQLIAPGTRVNVTVNPSSGYRLRWGSLETETTIATGGGRETQTREVLNKGGADTGFGKGEGKSFYFTMPEGATTLNAVFESTASTDTAQLPAATLGTGAYVNGNTVRGVRFLNRVYAQIDQNDGAVYVTYGGQKHKVKEIGSLLKRADNTVADLTLEAYSQYKFQDGAIRLWKTRAYVAADNKITLVDYTEEYLDFTIVMFSETAQYYSFVGQGYTTCAYVTLENGTTFYTEPFTDSVEDVLTRVR